MTINKILPAGLKLTAAVMTAAGLISLAACNKNKDKQEERQMPQTEMTAKNTTLPKYADLAMYYGWDMGKTNLKIEDGISFIADGIKYTSEDRLLKGEFLDTPNSPKEKNTFITNIRSFALPTYQTIKMVADFAKEEGSSDDVMVLSKEDIRLAQDKIKNGEIWVDGKAFFEKEGDESKYIGNAQSTKKPNGVELCVNYMSSEVSQTKFYD
ncbi:hypothetical protein IKQ21_04070 [bacterium]|nr:hypothetical protein [bacterium]